MSQPTSGQWQILNELAVSLQDRLPLESLLQRIAETAAQLLGSQRTSVRLLDPTRTRLLATCGAGRPRLTVLHAGEFRLGEGLIGWIAAECRPLRTGDAESDARFVRRDDVQARLGSFLGVPIIAGRACLGVLSALHPDPDYFSPEHEAILTFLAGVCAPHVELARLERLSQVDPLTGAYNRRGLDLIFPVSDDRAVAVFLADVDHFKRINDAYGHVIGDEALKRLVQILTAGLRNADALIRYGGEEFLAVLPQVRLQQAARIAERARASVEEAVILAAGVELRVTISLGVAERLPGESRDDVIRRADEALYAAKLAGRNRMVLSERRSPTFPPTVV